MNERPFVIKLYRSTLRCFAIGKAIQLDKRFFSIWNKNKLFLLKLRDPRTTDYPLSHILSRWSFCFYLRIGICYSFWGAWLLLSHHVGFSLWESWSKPCGSQKADNVVFEASPGPLLGLSMQCGSRPGIRRGIWFSNLENSLCPYY